MKKLFVIFLFALLLLAFVSCGDSSAPPLSSSSSSTGSSTAGSSTDDGEKEFITIHFIVTGDAELEGEDSITVEKNSTISALLMPLAYREGYELEYWAYDSRGDNPWSRSDTFFENTVLYAIWIEADMGGTDNGGTENSGTTLPPSGNEDSVTVEFNTGLGYFTDETYYEVEVKKGGRLNSFPTPLHDNPAMLFDGWYKDAACTVAASRSDKYEADTTLYACWIERTACTDGSYDHLYSVWDTDELPTCDKAGTYARYCNYCNTKQVKPGDPARGHNWGSWAETFMAKERSCNRLGCGEKEIVNFENITLEALGSAPSRQIEGSVDKFYGVPFTNLVNGNWNDSGSDGGVLSPKGQGTAYVIFTLIEPMYLDRIYFKGDGSVSMNIYVQYEGEEEFTFIGLCGGVADKENTPFKEPDSTRKIAKVKLQEDNPPNGTSLWQEIAFVRVNTEE